MKKVSVFTMIFFILFTCCGCGFFDKKEYNITYHLDGGINDDNPLVYTKKMKTIILKSPKKASCTFKGWYLDPEFKNEITKLNYTIKSDIDLYAKWAYGIVESVFNIDLGLKKEYVLFQISDTHINAGTTEYDKKNEEDRLLYSRISYANKFEEEFDVNYICKESKQGLVDLINYLNNENPYAVCYSGDIMDYYSESNYDFVKNEIEKTKVPFVYAIGNHESPASNFINMPGVASTDFTVLEFKEFEIVCIDNSTGYYTIEQYNNLLNETNKKKPIIIVEHTPLLTEYNLDSKLFFLNSYFFIDANATDENKKVVDLICNNEYIKLVLCGHAHGEIVSEIANGKKQIVCSSGLMGHINKIILN